MRQPASASTPHPSTWPSLCLGPTPKACCPCGSQGKPRWAGRLWPRRAVDPWSWRLARQPHYALVEHLPEKVRFTGTRTRQELHLVGSSLKLNRAKPGLPGGGRGQHYLEQTAGGLRDSQWTTSLPSPRVNSSPSVNIRPATWRAASTRPSMPTPSVKPGVAVLESCTRKLAVTPQVIPSPTPHSSLAGRRFPFSGRPGAWHGHLAACRMVEIGDVTEHRVSCGKKYPNDTRKWTLPRTIRPHSSRRGFHSGAPAEFKR